MIKIFFVIASILLLAGCGSEGARHKSGYYKDDLIGRGLPKTRPDALSSRRISLLHPQSGERLDIVYFRDGRYDPKAMRAIDRLFRDRRAGVPGRIDPELIDFLVDIRTRLALPPSVTFQILSGYRTPKTNADLARQNDKVANSSLHMRGWAVDFRVPGVDGLAVVAIAKTMQRGGASYYPGSNHVHVDIGNIRTWREK
ncbi:MAG: YcbK family protein [Bdellovibrionales bacterium]